MAGPRGGRGILSEGSMWAASSGETNDGPRGGRSVGKNTADASGPRGGRSTAESSTAVKREATTAGKEQTVVKERQERDSKEVNVDTEKVDKKLTNSS